MFVFYDGGSTSVSIDEYAPETTSYYRPDA